MATYLQSHYVRVLQFFEQGNFTNSLKQEEKIIIFLQSFGSALD